MESDSVINPSTGKVVASVSAGSPKDVDLAVKAAQNAFNTTWGLNTPGSQRGVLLNKLADLMEANAAELSAVESLDNGKAYPIASTIDIPESIATIRYYAGWADKVHGQTIETNEDKLVYTRHEPIGVVGQIIPWNFPREYLLSIAFKLAFHRYPTT